MVSQFFIEANYFARISVNIASSDLKVQKYFTDT